MRKVSRAAGYQEALDAHGIGTHTDVPDDHWGHALLAEKTFPVEPGAAVVTDQELEGSDESGVPAPVPAGTAGTVDRREENYGHYGPVLVVKWDNGVETYHSQGQDPNMEGIRAAAKREAVVVAASEGIALVDHRLEWGYGGAQDTVSFVAWLDSDDQTAQEAAILRAFERDENLEPGTLDDPAEREEWLGDKVIRLGPNDPEDPSDPNMHEVQRVPGGPARYVVAHMPTQEEGADTTYSLVRLVYATDDLAEAEAKAAELGPNPDGPDVLHPRTQVYGEPPLGPDDREGHDFYDPEVGWAWVIDTQSGA